MRRYERRNESKIRRSFDLLLRREYNVVYQGYCDYLQSALEYLAGTHDAEDHHVNEDDTMAWGLIHDREILRAEGYKGGEAVELNDAKDMLLDVVRSLPQKGWVGVIIAGMRGWYNVQKEIGYLNRTAEWARDNFIKNFKPIKR